LKIIKSKIFYYFFLMALTSCLFSFSNAQNMFFHLLPGFGTPFTWVGLGGDANWNTAANWNTGVVPGVNDTATFDDTCVSNCDPLINLAISIGGLKMKSTYAGTITQGAGNTITVGAGGWVQDAGTFTGNNSNVTITGLMAATAGNFNSSTANLIFKNTVNIAGLTFVHNSGTVDVDWNCLAGDVNFGVKTVHHFRIIGQCGTINLQASTITVNGTFDLRDSNGGILNNGTINAQGDVNLNNYASSGSAWIRLTGGNPQTVTNLWPAGSRPLLPNFEIAKTPATVVTFSGYVNLTRDYLYTSGDINFGTSEWHFVQGCATYNISPGTWDYPDVYLQHSCGTLNLNTQTFKVAGTLTLASSFVGMFSNGVIEAYGDINQVGTHGLYDANPVTGTLKIVGTGVQTLTGSTGYFPKMEVAKTGGTLNLAGTINLMSSYIYTSGVINAGTSNLNFAGNGTSAPGPSAYYDVSFTGSGKSQDFGGGSILVTNLLTIADTNASPGAINNGSINAQKNVVFSSFGKNGTAVLNYVSGNNSTLTIAGTAKTLDTTHTVAKTGLTTSVTLVADTSFATVGRNFLISTGTLDVAGFNFSVNNLITISVGGKLLCNGGTATAGSWIINGEISCGTGQGISWTGLAGDNLWSSAANWTNNTIPGAGEIGLFNAAVCVGVSCNAQIDSNLSVRGINLKTTYPGTLTQNTTRTLTIGTAGYTQAGGTFAGGDSAMTINGPFILSSGTFTATTATWSQTADLSVSGAPTFFHNSGTLSFEASLTVAPGTVQYNNVSFSGCGPTVSLDAGTMVVLGTISLSNGCGGGNLINGTIEARADVTAINDGSTGNAVILINGTGAQNLTASSSFVPSITINKPSGTLTMVGTIRTASNWTYTAGTVDTGTSTLSFEASLTVTPGTVQYNNVSFSGCGPTRNLNAGTMIVLGNILFASSCGNGNLINGTLEARADITSINSGDVGNAIILINGTGAQNLTSSSSFVPSITINKPSGTLTMVGTIRTASSWTYTAGTVNAGTSTLSFEASLTLTPGPVQYNNVSFSGCGTTTSLNSGVLILTGTLSLTGSCGGNQINSGAIEARGHVNVSGNYDGTISFKMNGTTSANLNWATGTFLSGTTMTTEKTGGASVVLAANTNFSDAGRDLTVTSGVLDLAGFDLTVNDILTVSVGAILKCNGGEFTAGTVTNNGTVNCPGYATYDFNWTGAGGNSNWSTPGNWQGGVAPGASDIVVFEDTYCGGNCNASIDASITIKGAHLRSPFTGTISQGLGNTVSVGTRGYYQYAGNFVGSNANISINLNSNSKAFSITGGSFTSTTATLQAGFTASSGGLTSRDTFILGAGATFNHNMGTVRLACYEAASGATVCSVNASSGIAFNNLSTYALDGYGGGVTVKSGQVLTVLGNLTVESGSLLDQTTGYIDLHGNLNASSNGTSNNKPGIVRLIGIGNQTYTTSGTGCTVRVEVNKASGDVNPIGADARLCSVKVSSGNFYAPTGTLYLGVSGHSIRSSINVLDLTSPAQFIDQGGTVDFNSIDVWSGTLIYTIKPSGTLTLSNVITRGVSGFSGGHWVSVGDKIVVANTFQKMSGRLGGSWELRGNSSFEGLSDSTATFDFTGGSVQMVSGTSAGAGSWTVNKTAGEIQFLNNINLSKVNQNLNIISGTLNMAGFNLTVANNITNSGSLKRGNNPACGTITQGGSFIGNGAICP
jgi:hypothetical protein